MRRRNLGTVSEPDTTEHETSSGRSDSAEPNPADPSGAGHRLSRRGWTVLLSVLVVLAFGLVGVLVKVPYVALGPGPTYNTLGVSDGEPVIEIDGEKTHKTTGQLRLTTVSVSDEVSLINGLGLWVSGRYALAPRELYFPPGESDSEVKEQNVKQFKDSQSNAEVAALRHLKARGGELADDIKIKVIAKEITDGSPADKVLDPGDQFIKVNGQPVGKAEDVRQALEQTRPGDKIAVTYRPEGEKRNRTGTITLGKAPDEREEGFMGLIPADRADVDFTIDIKLEHVGGPSAGMIFALAIVDQLTPGALTGGKRIAGTGEITEKGDVVPIGGISFKLVAAAEDGATAFLVPEANCAEAKRTAPDELQLAKVGTLDDAVTALEAIGEGKEPASC